MDHLTKKGRGFIGELIIDIPTSVLQQCNQTALISQLYIAKIGFFPKAQHHYYNRPGGISQVVLVYCVDGRGWIQVKKKKIPLEMGQIYVLPPNVPHSYGADEQSPWTIYWMHLVGKQSTEALSAIMNSKQAIPTAVKVGFSEQRNVIFRQIADTLLKGYSTSNLMFANLSVIYYLATFISPEFFQPATPASSQANATEKAIQFMLQHLTATLSLEEIAQAAHLSVSFFSRKFKLETGYTPIEYFNHLRIQKACQLLHFTRLRINEIAAEVGILDSFYFSRLFKKQMGISPVAYRKEQVER